MSFQVNDRTSFWWPVTVKQHSKTNVGTFEDATFEVEFLHIDEPTLVDLFTKAAAGDLQDIDACKTTLCTGAFRNVGDGAGNMLESTPENFDKLLRYRLQRRESVANVLCRVYFEAEGLALEKN